MGVCMLLCLAIAGLAAGTDTTGNGFQKTMQRMEMLERKIAAVEIKETQQREMLSNLREINRRQEDQMNKLLEENNVLKEIVYKVNIPATVEETLIPNGGRHRRQIINTTYEGPVAFMASFTSSCESNIGINQNIVFANMVTNLGGSYNQLHGVFTAPRAGVYLFSSSILSDTAAHSTNVHAAITLNGRIVAKMIAISEANKHRDQGAQTVILDLKQGDQVWVKNVDNNDVSICGLNGFSTFSGYMLYPY